MRLIIPLLDVGFAMSDAGPAAMHSPWTIAFSGGGVDSDGVNPSCAYGRIAMDIGTANQTIRRFQS